MWPTLGMAYTWYGIHLHTFELDVAHTWIWYCTYLNTLGLYVSHTWAWCGTHLYTLELDVDHTCTHLNTLGLDVALRPWPAGGSGPPVTIAQPHSLLVCSVKCPVCCVCDVFYIKHTLAHSFFRDTSHHHSTTLTAKC